MFIEHVIYSLAAAIFVSIFIRGVQGTHLWVILLGACAPDIDGIIDLVREPLFFTPTTLLPHMTAHSRYFHNIAVLVVFALLAGAVLYRYGHPFLLSAACAGFGFATHLFEDALVYAEGGAFLWPITSEPLGIGLFPGYSRDFFEVANAEVLSIGLLLLASVLLIEVMVHQEEAILPRKLAASFQALAVFRRE